MNCEENWVKRKQQVTTATEIDRRQWRTLEWILPNSRLLGRIWYENLCLYTSERPVAAGYIIRIFSGSNQVAQEIIELTNPPRLSTRVARHVTAAGPKN